MLQQQVGASRAKWGHWAADSCTQRRLQKQNKTQKKTQKKPAVSNGTTPLTQHPPSHHVPSPRDVSCDTHCLLPTRSTARVRSSRATTSQLASAAGAPNANSVRRLAGPAATLTQALIARAALGKASTGNAVPSQPHTHTRTHAQTANREMHTPTGPRTLAWLQVPPPKQSAQRPLAVDPITAVTSHDFPVFAVNTNAGRHHHSRRTRWAQHHHQAIALWRDRPNKGTAIPVWVGSGVGLGALL